VAVRLGDAEDDGDGTLQGQSGCLAPPLFAVPVPMLSSSRWSPPAQV
jgi:hypothetical protein